MKVVLHVRSGPQKGAHAEVSAGKPVRVGRSAKKADLVIEDALVNASHLAVELRKDGLWLADLQSLNGTQLNGARVQTEARLKHGDRIRAGDTELTLRIEPTAPPPIASVPPTPAEAEIARLLAAEPEPLFAVLDAARDRRVRRMLRAASEEQASLYEGGRAKVLEEFAPHLVRLPAGSPLLPILVHEGWGNSFGVYITSRLPFTELRRHLRRFLVVREEETREELYFRFYDPRVLRVFLPSSPPAQAAEIFGGIGAFLLEDADPGVLLRLSHDGRELRRDAVRLDARRAQIPAREAVPAR